MMGMMLVRVMTFVSRIVEDSLNAFNELCRPALLCDQKFMFVDEPSKYVPAAALFAPNVGRYSHRWMSLVHEVCSQPISVIPSILKINPQCLGRAPLSAFSRRVEDRRRRDGFCAPGHSQQDTRLTLPQGNFLHLS